MHRFGSVRGDIDQQAIVRDIDKLEALVADLWAISSPFDHRQLYNSRTMGGAPLLEDWKLVVRPMPCLEGLATGHPSFPGSKRPIVTSHLWLLSPELGLARTFSRWYRLGEWSSQRRKES